MAGRQAGRQARKKVLGRELSGFLFSLILQQRFHLQLAEDSLFSISSLKNSDASSSTLLSLSLSLSLSRMVVTVELDI